jgi:hypothetical protein
MLINTLGMNFAIKEKMADTNPLSGVVAKFLEMESQLQVFHWQTFGLGIHRGIGKLYEALVEQADEFTETGMGIYGRPTFGQTSLPIQDFSEEVMNAYLNDGIAFLKGLNQVFPNDSDLLNIRDTIMGEFNRTKYLITLK